MKDFDAQVQKLGSVGAALNWARENGYELPPANQELPPVAEQGALAAAAQAADTGEEETMDDTADTGGMGGLDLATLDLGQIKTDPAGFFKSILEANQAAEQRAALSAKQLYDAGRQRIMEKYAGPKRSEQLFALSQAMLSPRDTPGFGGFLANVTGALGANAKAVRDAEQAREEQLLALQQQYQQGEAARMAARPKTAADLASKYIAATKAPAKSSVSPIMVGSDLQPRIRATGAKFVEPPQDEIYVLQAYINDPANTPENKVIARKNFDKAYGYGAAAIYVGD